MVQTYLIVFSFEDGDSYLHPQNAFKDDRQHETVSAGSMDEAIQLFKNSLIENKKYKIHAVWLLLKEFSNG